MSGKDIAKFITSPPAVVAACIVIYIFIIGSFKFIEDILTSDTKISIWIWISGETPSKRFLNRFQNWPRTFEKIIDQVFGSKYLSWKCFYRSCLFSLASLTFCLLYFVPSRTGFRYWLVVHGVWMLPFSNLFPDYLCVLETRFAVKLLATATKRWMRVFILVADLAITAVTSGVAVSVVLGPLTKFVMPKPVFFNTSPTKQLISDLIDNSSYFLLHPLMAVWNAGHLFSRPELTGGNFGNVFFYPAFFTSIWLWLYATSGLILKTLRRIDIGFSWYNRNFDIENRPLQSISPVFGLLAVAMFLSIVFLLKD